MESPKPPDSPAEQQAPLAISRYQIQEELGRGAMGAVYKAFDPVIGRTIALKTILIDKNAPDRAQMIERLKQEAKAAGGLDHPNIITIYDVGEENGDIYLSMQYVQGITLAEVLANSGVPALPTLLAWADQITSAVGFAHARGVIHRDLKPSNLMVTDQGAIKVLDFGIAKLENTTLTQTGLVIGTPGYFSPEQIAGRKVDQRADIFSLGAVFYELLTREKAFDGDIVTTLYKIVNEDPVAPSIINPAIPGGIDAVIRKALAKDPKDRFQNCEEMRKAFLEQSVRAPLAMPVVAEKVAAERGPKPASTHRFGQREVTARWNWLGLILASALLMIAAVSWAFYIRSRTGKFPPFLQKVTSKRKQVLSARKPAEYSPPALHHESGEHNAAAAPAQNVLTTDSPATASQNAGGQTPSGSTSAATLQPVAAVSNTPAESQNVPDPFSPPAGISQKPGEPSQAASAPAAKPSDNDQPVTESVPDHDTTGPSDASGQDNNEESAVQPRSLKRKHAPDAPAMIDGFTRQDVPDLLRQADSYAARGEYRLARYEYGLVLKLDRNNVQAREGLRRLLAASQPR